jgi:hypothetical protein
VYHLAIHPDADADLEGLWETSPDAAARITAILEKIEASQELLDALTIEKYGEKPKDLFDVSSWLRYLKRGKHLWRFKVWDLEQQGLKYRVIYAYEPRGQRYTVLGVFERGLFDYDDSDNPLHQRVLRAYDSL